MLGICRGMQALNVSRGGTLHQHLPDRTDLEHDQGYASFEPAHGVSVAIGSLLHRLAGAADARRQLLPPPGRRPARPWPGGLRGRPGRHRRGDLGSRRGFCLGVQWHPEVLTHRAEHAPLVQALVDAARTPRRRSRSPPERPRLESAAVLTDYHVHLRPDEPGTPASEYFTAGNAERYRAAAEEHGIQELGVAEHVYRFSAALEVWEHPFWRQWATDDLDEYCGFVREETDLRLGIEADFVPGREDRIANLLDGRDWDFVVGSVHFLRDASLDTEDYSIWGTGESAEKIWRRYFDTIAESALSGLYDVIGHPDLVKVWGDKAPRPDKDLRYFYEPAVEAFAEAGVAVELSTAGLRKPVGEQYPARPYLEMILEAGCPIALSSDAHLPEQLGFRYEQALELLDELGVKELAVFERRQRRMEAIG